MKKKWLAALLALCMLVSLAACGNAGNGDTPQTTDNGGGQSNTNDANSEDLLLHLAFDEGSGLMVKDSSGHLPDTEMNYGFAHATYMENQDPQWRTEGISGGCLLLDGASTYVQYKRNDITIEGPALTIQVWVAPRMFEWDDPNAADNGTDAPTGIFSQSDKENNKGILLGYERFGRLTFQVGIGDDWLTCWTNGDNLMKYEWNLVTATFDSAAGEMKLYLNDVMCASCSVPDGAEIVGANKTLTVGRNIEAERLTAGFLNMESGYIDELKVYSKALSGDDVKNYYNSVDIPAIDFDQIWLQNIITTDYTRPQFHGGPYQFWMNEPHAPVYYNGMYHLFYQANMTGSYWRNICWGHMVSTDMVNWKPIKEAIVPTEDSVVPDGVWSGGATLDKNGVPLLFFTAGNDDFRNYDGLISNQNIGCAYPADLNDPELTDWVICDELAVIQKQGQGRPGEFRDPHIWKEGDTWCMLICSGAVGSTGGTALLYTTDTLELKDDGTVDMDWQYKGPVYEMENQAGTYGTSWELPIILPVTNEAGTITKYFFSISPAPASSADNKVYYWLGNFDLETGKFTPDEAFQGDPHMLDYGDNVFTGPSCLVDPVSGNIYMFSIMQDQRGAAEQGASGWAHTVGLARRIWLNDDGTDLMMSPIDALSTLEEEVLIDETNLSIDDANAKLAAVDCDMLVIRLTADVSACEEFSIAMKQGGKWDATTFRYRPAENKIYGRTENKGEGSKLSSVSGDLPNEDGKISMEIYIDRSLVEGFFNEYKAISMRAYTEEPDSHGISVASEGSVTIDSLYVARMGSIFD